MLICYLQKHITCETESRASLRTPFPIFHMWRKFDHNMVSMHCSDLDNIMIGLFIDVYIMFVIQCTGLW